MAARASSFAADLSALLRSMPNRHASLAERADWFDRKAALFDQVAARARNAATAIDRALGEEGSA